MNKKQLEELIKVLEEADSLSSVSYNLGWLDGKELKKEPNSKTTRKWYAKEETRIDNLIFKAKNKLKKLLAK